MLSKCTLEVRLWIDLVIFSFLIQEVIQNVSLGCPKRYSNYDIHEAPVTSKYAVRCCSYNGKSCVSGPCKTITTYAKAFEICEKREMRLCYENEIDTCCGSGCTLDPKYVWLLDNTAGIEYLNNRR